MSLRKVLLTPTLPLLLPRGFSCQPERAWGRNLFNELVGDREWNGRENHQVISSLCTVMKQKWKRTHVLLDKS